MSVVQEFKKFALRGNVVDLAVGIIIGAAFGKVVSALVDAIFMPVLGLFLGTVSFSGLSVTLRDAAGDKPALVMNYGAFLQAAFDFVIVSFAIFLLVKGINRLRHEHEAAPKPAETPPQEKLLAEIRDLLRARA